MTKILAISSALPFTEIALTDGDKTLYYRGWQSDYNEAEKLLEHLRAILALKTGIDKVAVVSGPGGFTGLRVGVTMANTLAYSLKVKVVEIETAELLKAKSPKGTIILQRVNTDGIKGILKGNRRAKFATGDLTEEQVEKYLPKKIEWLELKNLKPLNAVINHLPPGGKTVKPRYFAPPKITKSKKQIFN